MTKPEKRKARPGWWRKKERPAKRPTHQGKPVMVLDGRKYEIRIEDRHVESTAKRAGEMIVAGELKLDGRDVIETIDAWVNSDDGLAYMVWLSVNPEYMKRARPGRVLTPERVKSLIKPPAATAKRAELYKSAAAPRAK